jgi:hypothetical protein
LRTRRKSTLFGIHCREWNPAPAPFRHDYRRVKRECINAMGILDAYNIINVFARGLGGGHNIVTLLVRGVTAGGGVQQEEGEQQGRGRRAIACTV